jgi:pyruvate dehydrogenase E2 component (dihydrolipoamide acetyltransferase)
MFGITHFSAVINPPQACILAVGAGIPRVVSDSSDQPTKATMLEATLSMDSRAVDAFVAEEFLTSFKQFIEDPTSMII